MTINLLQNVADANKVVIECTPNHIFTEQEIVWMNYVHLVGIAMMRGYDGAEEDRPSYSWYVIAAIEWLTLDQLVEVDQPYEIWVKAHILNEDLTPNIKTMLKRELS